MKVHFTGFHYYIQDTKCNIIIKCIIISAILPFTVYLSSPSRHQRMDFFLLHCFANLILFFILLIFKKVRTTAKC